MPPRFEVVIDGEWLKWYNSQPDSVRQKVGKAKAHLEHNPFFLPGKIKKLKGQYERYGWQYDVDDRIRMWYIVEGNRVTVTYLGPHPTYKDEPRALVFPLGAVGNFTPVPWGDSSACPARADCDLVVDRKTDSNWREKRGKSWTGWTGKPLRHNALDNKVRVLRRPP